MPREAVFPQKTFADGLRETGHVFVEMVKTDDGRVRLTRSGYAGDAPWAGQVSYPSKAEAIRCAVARGWMVRESGRLIPHGMVRQRDGSCAARQVSQ